MVISAARPEYPYEARRQRLTGTGIAIMEVDPATGRVTRAFMAESTGSAILDRAALNAFQQWRFKPGAVAGVRIPITFSMTGGHTYTEYKVDKKPMDHVLAGFLGRGTVLKGAIPEYPRFPPWRPKRGKGVYEMHAGKDGRVAAVRILKSSGDETFDRVTVKTLRKWQFRRGPLIVELPLSFTLTPTNYSVDVAR